MAFGWGRRDRSGSNYGQFERRSRTDRTQREARERAKAEDDRQSREAQRRTATRVPGQNIPQHPVQYQGFQGGEVKWEKDPLYDRSGRTVYGPTEVLDHLRSSEQFDVDTQGRPAEIDPLAFNVLDTAADRAMQEAEFLGKERAFLENLARPPGSVGSDVDLQPFGPPVPRDRARFGGGAPGTLDAPSGGYAPQRRPEVQAPSLQETLDAIRKRPPRKERARNLVRLH